MKNNIFNATIYAFVFDLQLFADTVVPGNAAANMMTSGSEDLSAEFAEVNNQRFVGAHSAKLVYDKYASNTAIPSNSGETVKYFKKTHLLPADAPLTEGQTPDPDQVKIESFTADVENYGRYVMYSDVATMTALHNLVSVTTDLQADQAAKTKNLLVRDTLLAGCGYAYASYKDANGKTVKVTSLADLNAGSLMTVAEVKKMVNRFRRNDVEPVMGDFYVMFIHPDIHLDLSNDPEYKAIHQYTDTAPLQNGELGRIEGMIFLDTTTALVTKEAASGAVPAYHNIAVGKDAYEIIKLEGGDLKRIVKGLGSGGTADPLDQRCTVGWKMFFGCVVLDEQAVYDLITTSTNDEVEDEGPLNV